MTIIDDGKLVSFQDFPGCRVLLGNIDQVFQNILPKYFEILGHHLRFYLLGDIAEKCHHIIKCNINACRKDKLKTTGDYNYITPKHITFPGCILLPENKKYKSLAF